MSSASALCLLLCSDSCGAPRSSRTGEQYREIGILLGIEIEGASICPKIIGKAAGHESFPRRKNGPSFIEYVNPGLCRDGNRETTSGYYTQPGVGRKLR
jgi:hypothetical protein